MLSYLFGGRLRTKTRLLVSQTVLTFGFIRVTDVAAALDVDVSKVEPYFDSAVNEALTLLLNNVDNHGIVASQKAKLERMRHHFGPRLEEDVATRIAAIVGLGGEFGAE